MGLVLTTIDMILQSQLITNIIANEIYQIGWENLENTDEIYNAPWKYINPDGSLDLQHIIKIKENLK